jgi:hypothetical protein
MTPTILAERDAVRSTHETFIKYEALVAHLLKEHVDGE